MSKASTSRLTTIELFCRAAETASFTLAAEQMGATPSAVSKAVRRLEDQLGVRLFERTTRAIRLTREGVSYHATCRDALNRIHEAEELLSRQRRRPHGTLRISIPPSFGIVDLVPRLPKYLAKYGYEVKLFASLTNSLADFVSQGFDLAIRLGTIADSRLVARKLRDASMCVVASPAYLNVHGIPAHPDELRGHRCIDLILPDTQRPVPWQFQEGQRLWQVPVTACITVDQPLAVMSAARAGAGVARLLDFSLAEQIASGQLVEVLPAFRAPATPLSIVYPARRHLSANVRTFVDFVVAEYAASGSAVPAALRAA